jgi:uncharacterized repeat protein (TIGR03803 family)
VLLVRSMNKLLTRLVCIAGFCVATNIFCFAQTFTVLDSFDGSNGSQPNVMSLIQGTDGHLYGTTPDTIFKITPGGTLTTVGDLSYGFYSTAGLVQANDANFYGTAEEGGAHNAGTVFKITPTGDLNTIYSFCARTNCIDGYQPDAGLVQGTDGNLYGTTQIGGANDYGTVFKITLSGNLTTVYSFCAQTNCTDGSYPNTALVEVSDGTFYGTAASTFFKITPDGKFATIYNFGSTQSFEGLVQATDGNFYGTVVGGGSRNDGSVIRLTPSGVLTTIYTFCTVFEGGKCLDGIQPYGTLIQASDGNLYGTTYLGGNNNAGTIFEMTLDGVLTTLYSFCPQTACDDGDEPFGGLAQATNGIFYGTTWAGGTYDLGTIFSIAVGLGPFVEARPGFGKVGAPVTILGTNLKGTTGVSFNGTAASFTVVSASQITTSIPAGATTGKIRVTTPRRTLSGNGPFRVIR